jgi:DNA-binding NtrC family response regulator
MENVIERAMILTKGPMLAAVDLDFGRRPAPAPAPVTPAPVDGGDGGRSLYKRLSEQERSEIVAAVERSQGNIAHAARALGINRSTLYYRMRKHGLEHLLPTKEESTEPRPGS